MKPKIHDCRTKGIKSSELIPKDVLITNNHLTLRDISEKTGFSIYMVKKSLVQHGLYRGKYYTLVCECCGNDFRDYVSTKKFCSNNCKHTGQNIWNRGLTKDSSSILEKSSEKMKGNKLGHLVDHSNKNRETLLLPNLNKNISYDKSSKLEKEWLLQVDSCDGIVDIKPSEIKFKYKDCRGNDLTYYPDYEVVWETGVRWIVEIKGRATDKDYKKIEQISRWAKENRYDYKLVTTGMVKRNNWNETFVEYGKLIHPTPEYVMMSHACTVAKMSTSTRLHVGAVITSMDCREMYGYGFNGDEKGGINVPTTNKPGSDGFIHAEENALLKMQTKEECKMFISTMPCLGCAKRIVNAGNIREVYYLLNYRDVSGVSLLMKSGIPVYKFQLTDFEGKVFSDIDAYKQLIPGGMEDL
jgi:deoxycytidylate deaminase